ncbi:hypothetical protein [Butyrivibrio sp. AE2032]|uniref:hypothetical protein n=1 Tax=Butyrivibrio sp. AE2032 TaxID=1458463 RepID=UPI0005531C4A|nr:hypothetical protein [Butyrivibrio sp. AE2032]
MGTFLKSVKLCAVKRGFVQKIIFQDLFSSIDYDYAPDESLIGHLVRGAKNPSPAFIEKINNMDSQKYFEIAGCMDIVADKIDPNKVKLLEKLLKRILDEDDSIAQDTIVDLINGTAKQDFPGKYETLSSLLAGVFLYVIKNTDNKNQTDSVKEIDDNFIAEIISETIVVNTSSTEKNDTNDFCENEELQARRFMIRYENKKELIPLCQIAYVYNPTHNYERTMYTEYNLFSENVREYILNRCDASISININELHWEEGLSLLCDDLEKYELSSHQYIYLFRQYFPKFQYYSSLKISNYEIYTFKRIITSKKAAVHLGLALCSLDAYIDDYLWLKENNQECNYPKPMDCLFVSKSFSNCPEEDVIFWLCRFVIDACNNLSSRIIGKPTHVDCFDENAETIEDLSLSALLALYRHYAIHQNNYDELHIICDEE